MKKILSQCLVLFLLAFALSACNGNTTQSNQPPTDTPPASSAPTPGSSQAASTPAPTPEPTPEAFTEATVRVAYMPNMGGASLLATALDKGFFTQMGLNVVPTEFQSGPPEIAAMASGDIDVAYIGHGAHALCIEGQAVIFQLDCIGRGDAVLGNTDKGVNTIADLRGKSVAVTSGTSSEMILSLALQSVGMTKDDVNLVEIDANGMVAAMASGNVDACAAWSPNTITIAAQLGSKCITLADNEMFMDQVTFAQSYITTQNYVDSNRDVLIRFCRALQMAMDYRNANINEVADLVAKFCEADTETMRKSTGEQLWVKSSEIGNWLASGELIKIYEAQQKAFLDSGRIPEPVDVRNYILFDIMQEAYSANN